MNALAQVPDLGLDLRKVPDLADPATRGRLSAPAIAAFFAIDIDGLPHLGDTQVLPMGFVLKYVFTMPICLSSTYSTLMLQVDSGHRFVHRYNLRNNCSISVLCPLFGKRR